MRQEGRHPEGPGGQPSASDLPRVIHGNRDMIEMLSELLGQARAGEVEAIVIGAAGKGQTWTQWAYNGGAAYVYPRLLTLVAHAHADLMREGL